MVTIISRLNLKEAIGLLVKAAHHPDSRVAKEVMKGLYRSASSDHAPLIQELLQHPDKTVRLQAIPLVALQNITAAVPALVEIAGSMAPADTDARALCLQALMKLKAPDTCRVALAILDRKPGSHAEVPERTTAVRILGELGLAEYRTAIERIAASDPQPEVRAVASSYLK